VKKTSLAEAKAHLSALVDEAQHHNKRVIILRHGKPAAAIVPVDVAVERRPPARVRLSTSQIQELFGRLGTASPHASAVADLLDSRR
jgi:prevent-host-death family protein